VQNAEYYANRLITELIDSKIGLINEAIVSGSVRCVETFAIIWRELHKRHIKIESNEIHKQFFSTRAEDVGWKEFYRANHAILFNRIEAVGEKKAVMEGAGHLVRPCVKRTVTRIKKGLRDGARTILVVTHSPHDVFIEKAFTGVEQPKCLEQGHYRIIRF
jgi:broad specificity phosphatase PhoE